MSLLASVVVKHHAFLGAHLSEPGVGKCFNEPSVVRVLSVCQVWQAWVAVARGNLGTRNQHNRGCLVQTIHSCEEPFVRSSYLGVRGSGVFCESDLSVNWEVV